MEGIKVQTVQTKVAESIAQRVSLKTFFPQTIKNIVEKKVPTVAELEAGRLLARISETKKRLESLRNGYEQQIDFDMVDVYIHAITSVEKEYSHLIKEARRTGVRNQFTI